MENNVPSSYYAIIPAYIRYNKELKFAERLMYGEITALSNKEGYCFASNRYFAELIERRIYVVDNPYMQNNQYPYVQNSILLGLSLGLWEVFKPIWLLERGISIESLGVTFFVALFIVAIISLTIGNKVMKIGIRKSIQLALIARVLIFFSMIITKNKHFMILLSCLDLLIDTLIIQWMYPLLSQIRISNVLFGLKDNLYDLAGNIGTIIAGIFVGITLYKLTSYQICITICMTLFFTCFVLLFKIENKKIILQHKNITKEILKVESSREYIKYSCSRRLQLYLILGFFMVMLTENLGIDKSFAGISWAILQIGVLVSFKSDKINRVKFFKWANISSIIILLIAGLSKNIIFSFIAILLIDILSDFYSPMIDAPLTNEMN